MIRDFFWLKDFVGYHLALRWRMDCLQHPGQGFKAPIGSHFRWEQKHLFHGTAHIFSKGVRSGRWTQIDVFVPSRLLKWIFCSSSLHAARFFYILLALRVAFTSCNIHYQYLQDRTFAQDDTQNDDGGLQSAAPATKNATHLLQNLRKYCASPTKRFWHFIRHVRMSRSATPAMQNSILTSIETFQSLS